MRNISTHGHPSDGRRRGEPGIRYSDAQRRRKTRTRTGSHCRSSSTKPKGSSSVPMASQKSNSRQQVLQSHLRNPIALRNLTLGPPAPVSGQSECQTRRSAESTGCRDAWTWRGYSLSGATGGFLTRGRAAVRTLTPGDRAARARGGGESTSPRCSPNRAVVAGRDFARRRRRTAGRRYARHDHDFGHGWSWRSLLDTGHHRERQGRKSWRRRSTRRRTPAASMSTCSSRVRMPAQCSSRTDSWKSCSHKTRSFFPREAETVPWARSWPARLAERSGYSSSTTSPTAIVPPVTTALSSATRPPKSSTMRWSTPRSWACVSGS